jgi:flagella basal body P-ring formation protein FlgA
MRASLLILVLALRPALAECVAISGDDIHARDLARAAPAFSAAGPDEVLGRTPAAGVRRVFTVRDLMAAARLAGIDEPELPTGGVCFERAVHLLTEEDLRAAMAAALPGISVQIAITDFSRYPVPEGHLAFPVSGLGMPPPAHPETPVVWRGKIALEGGRSTEIWARVRIVAMNSACVAVTDIRAGSQIGAIQIRMTQIAGFPLRSGPQIGDVRDVLGRVARHSIAAGQEILPRMLDEIREIHAGDRVQVLADCGNARVSLEAVALGDGRKGETIVVRNPATHSAFRAIVQARGQVVVHAGRGDRS